MLVLSVLLLFLLLFVGFVAGIVVGNVVVGKRRGPNGKQTLESLSCPLRSLKYIDSRTNLDKADGEHHLVFVLS